MTVKRQLLGRLGEDMAVAYLRANGYEILHRNFERLNAEIDIIAQEKDTTVFIEVKTFERINRLESPLVNVTKSKQAQIIKAARCYLAGLEDAEIKCRFDVVGVIPGAAREIDHIKGAFVA